MIYVRRAFLKLFVQCHVSILAAGAGKTSDAISILYVLATPLESWPTRDRTLLSVWSAAVSDKTGLSARMLFNYSDTFPPEHTYEGGVLTNVTARGSSELCLPTGVSSFLVRSINTKLYM